MPEIGTESLSYIIALAQTSCQTDRFFEVEMAGLGGYFFDDRVDHGKRDVLDPCGICFSSLGACVPSGQKKD